MLTAYEHAVRGDLRLRPAFWDHWYAIVTTAPSDEDLMDLVRDDGDNTAFTELRVRHDADTVRPACSRKIRRWRSGRRQLIEDASQETWKRLWTYRARWNRTKGQFIGYVQQIATNAAREIDTSSDKFLQLPSFPDGSTYEAFFGSAVDRRKTFIEFAEIAIATLRLRQVAEKRVLIAYYYWWDREACSAESAEFDDFLATRSDGTYVMADSHCVPSEPLSKLIHDSHMRNNPQTEPRAPTHHGVAELFGIKDWDVHVICVRYRSDVGVQLSH
jgi:DNA-directed RNA polymerase specialized sigma24 family protein